MKFQWSWLTDAIRVPEIGTTHTVSDGKRTTTTTAPDGTITIETWEDKSSSTVTVSRIEKRAAS